MNQSDNINNIASRLFGPENPDVILVSIGTNENLMRDVAVLLTADEIKASIVRISNIKAFNQLSETARANFLPSGTPKFSLVADSSAVTTISGFDGKTIDPEGLSPMNLYLRLKSALDMGARYFNMG